MYRTVAMVAKMMTTANTPANAEMMYRGSIVRPILSSDTIPTVLPSRVSPRYALKAPQKGSLSSRDSFSGRETGDKTENESRQSQNDQPSPIVVDPMN
jgi:hypothetical protein